MSVLCAPRIVRTAKFVCGLAYVPEVVSTSFLDHCLTKKEIPPFHEHWLVDEDGQKKMGSTISETLKRAKQNNRKLLKGWQIFCTDKIAGGFDTYKEIIEVNSGSCHQFKGRVNVIVSKRVANTDIPEVNRREDRGDTLYLLSGSTLEEVALKEKFKKMAREAGMVPRVVKPDWLLGITMSQKIYWKDEWEHL
jgi:hypothetical protein